MNIYDKIKRMTCKESYDEKMYQPLSSKKYSNFPYSTQNLGEDITFVNQAIMGYFKPRFLLADRSRCAYEFMDSHECLTTVTDNDTLRLEAELAVKRH